MTQENVAEAANISIPYYSQIENGAKSISAFYLASIAKALNVSTEYLLNEDDETELEPYTEIATAIARNGGALTAEEKNKLIALILGSGE